MNRVIMNLFELFRLNHHFKTFLDSLFFKDILRLRLNLTRANHAYNKILNAYKLATKSYIHSAPTVNNSKERLLGRITKSRQIATRMMNCKSFESV